MTAYHQITTCSHAIHIPYLAFTSQLQLLLQGQHIPFKQAAIQKPAFAQRPGIPLVQQQPMLLPPSSILPPRYISTLANLEGLAAQ